MSRRLALSLSALLLGTILLVAAGLAGAKNAGDRARKGGTLRLSRFSDVDFVDPALAYASWSWPVSFATCAKLFNYPDEPGAAGTRVVPEVVRAFTVSRDGRTYTFDLKQSFRFHTGAAVTARSFADALNRDAAPEMRSPAVAYLHEIVGADAVIGGKAREISGVRVLGRYRLQIRLTRMLADFTARLTMPFFCPVLPGTPIDPAGIDNPAGSGPYYVAERIVNRRIVLKRNAHYRGGRPANADQVVWTIGESREQCLADTEQDQVDHCVVNGVPTTSYQSLAATYGINRAGGQFFVAPTLTTWYFAFNHDRPAFRGAGQIPLKKAINQAIDRPALARTFGYLAGRRTDQMLPPALGRDASIYPLRGADVAAAKRSYAQAGLKPDKLVLYAFNVPTGVAAAQVLAFNMKQIGIDLDVRYFDGATLAQRAATRGEPYDLVQHGWTADYADPAGFLEVLLARVEPSANANFAYFERPWVSARIEAANRLTGAARRKAWAELDIDVMRRDPPWAPYVHFTQRSFVSRSVGCYFIHPVYILDIAAVCKK